MIIRVVKRALEGSIDKIAKNAGLNKDKAIRQAGEKLAAFSNEWFSGDAPTLSYNDPLSRWAYCFAHVPANANLISDTLFEFAKSNTDFYRVVLGKEHVTFCAIGGGPGTELLGISKFYKTHAKFGEGKDIDVHVLDAEPGWQENLASLSREVKSELKSMYSERKNFPFSHSHTFCLVNTGDEDSYANYADVISADVVICSYFVSEIYDFESLQTLIDEMKFAGEDRPYFLVLVDRRDADTRKKMKQFIEALNAEVLMEQSFETRLDNDEQTSELSEYIDKVGRRPRTQWKAATILARVGPAPSP